jgi:hypothetical protein
MVSRENQTFSGRCKLSREWLADMADADHRGRHNTSYTARSATDIKVRDPLKGFRR